MTAPLVERIGPAPHIAVEHVGAGEAVVFLHGIGGNRTNWRRQLAALADEFHAIAWDARGYGDSDDYDGPLDFDDFRADLARVLDHFGARRAHIVGLSMGGRIAASFNAAFPERVASLTLADTHLGFARFSQDARQRFVAARRDPLLAGKEPADIAAPLAASLIGDPANVTAVAELEASISALHKASYIKAVEASTDLDQVDLFDRVEAPTLILVGELDRLTPPKVAREIADRIAHARLEIIPGAGHLPNIETPDAFNRLLRDFLTGL